MDWNPLEPGKEENWSRGWYALAYRGSGGLKERRTDELLELDRN